MISAGQLKRQIPSEWPENTDSSDMMQGRCRTLQDGTGKMQILLGWCMMMQTPPVVKEDAYPTRMAQG
jgi:hypothetical protein